MNCSLCLHLRKKWLHAQMQPVCLFLTYQIFRHKWPQKAYPRHLPSSKLLLLWLIIAFIVLSILQPVIISSRFILLKLLLRSFLPLAQLGRWLKVYNFQNRLVLWCISSQYLWHYDNESNASVIKLLAMQNKYFFRTFMRFECLCYASGDKGNWLPFLFFWQLVGPIHVEYPIPLVPDSSLLLSWVEGSYGFFFSFVKFNFYEFVYSLRGFFKLHAFLL